MKKFGMGQCIDIYINSIDIYINIYIVYDIVAAGLSHETMCLYKLLLNVVHFQLLCAVTLGSFI